MPERESDTSVLMLQDDARTMEALRLALTRAGIPVDVVTDLDQARATFFGAGGHGCLVVAPNYRRQGTGDAMLGFMERTAVSAGIENIFALSTVTMQWFLERAFTEVSLDALPERRVAIYDKARNSKIYMKSVSDSTRLLDAEELFAGL